MAETLINLVQVTKHYKRDEINIPVLDNIDLEIGRGEFLGLMGPSGSGKTTLLNLIAGIDKPNSGRVVVDGKDISRMNEQQLAKWRARHVGFIFQLYNLIPVLSAFENVELPLRFAEVDRSRRQPLTRQALARVGLDGRLRHRPSELSGGEQQRASLARALVNQPQLLLADEPTGNLDSRTGAEVLDLIRDLNQSLGMTVVLVTHERALAERYAQRLIFLADGKLVDAPPNHAAPTMPTTYGDGR